MKSKRFLGLWWGKEEGGSTELKFDACMAANFLEACRLMPDSDLIIGEENIDRLKTFLGTNRLVRNSEEAEDEERRSRRAAELHRNLMRIFPKVYMQRIDFSGMSAKDLRALSTNFVRDIEELERYANKGRRALRLDIPPRGYAPGD